jgi:hypothetical protein
MRAAGLGAREDVPVVGTYTWRYVKDFVRQGGGKHSGSEKLFAASTDDVIVYHRHTTLLAIALCPLERAKAHLDRQDRQTDRNGDFELPFEPEVLSHFERGNQEPSGRFRIQN